MAQRPYEKLAAWKVSHELALAVYRVTRTFPKEEQYGLTSQTRRAALSAPTNIVEGSCRRGAREFRRYLDIARSSLTELAYLLRFARDAEVLSEPAFDDLDKQVGRAGFLTWRLYRSMASR